MGCGDGGPNCGREHGTCTAHMPGPVWDQPDRSWFKQPGHCSQGIGGKPATVGLRAGLFDQRTRLAMAALDGIGNGGKQAARRVCVQQPCARLYGAGAVAASAVEAGRPWSSPAVLTAHCPPHVSRPFGDQSRGLRAEGRGGSRAAEYRKRSGWTHPPADVYTNLCGLPALTHFTICSVAAEELRIAAERVRRRVQALRAPTPTHGAGACFARRRAVQRRHERFWRSCGRSMAASEPWQLRAGLHLHVPRSQRPARRPARAPDRQEEEPEPEPRQQRRLWQAGVWPAAGAVQRRAGPGHPAQPAPAVQAQPGPAASHL